MKKMKRILSMALAIVLTLTMFSAISMPTVEAKTKTKTIKVTMYVGERFSFDNLYISPRLILSMKTSNKKVVKVNKKEGMLVAKKAGKATITYTTGWYEGAKWTETTKKVKITVKNHPTASGCDYTLSAFRPESDSVYSSFNIHCDNVKLKYPKEFTSYRTVTSESYHLSVTFDGTPIDRIDWCDTYKVTDVQSGYTDDSGVWHDGSTTLIKIDRYDCNFESSIVRVHKSVGFFLCNYFVSRYSYNVAYFTIHTVCFRVTKLVLAIGI